jgi:hypothetical protein
VEIGVSFKAICNIEICYEFLHIVSSSDAFIVVFSYMRVIKVHKQDS